MVHPCHMVRDTSTTRLLSRLASFPSKCCPSLRTLANKLLNRSIQVRAWDERTLQNKWWAAVLENCSFQVTAFFTEVIFWYLRLDLVICSCNCCCNPVDPITLSGWEARSLFSGGCSGCARPLQAGGGGVGAGGAEQAEGWRRSTRAKLLLIKALHAGRVLAGWHHCWWLIGEK